MQTVSHGIIQTLEAYGVTHIFGVPGEENLAMLEAIRTSSITLIVTRHEQTAVFMAATYGRLTGKIGVAIATLGPGATNMMTGVAYAQLGGMPVLLITGQKPAKKSKQGRFQIIDVVGMMKPITKFTTALFDPSRIVSTLHYAIQCAESEKPGAVHCELAEDIAEEQMTIDSIITPLAMRRPIPDQKAITQFFDLLGRVRRPVILIGPGANRKRITKYLTKVIEKYNIPFFSSQMGKGVVDERLTQYIGTAALTAGDHVHAVLSQADCIIAIGHDTSEKPTYALQSSNNPILVHCDFSLANITELYQPDMQIVGDIGNFLRQRSESSLDFSHRETQSMIAAAHDLAIIRDSAWTHQDIDHPLGPQFLIHHLRTLLPDDAIVSLDNGLYKVWFARNYRAYHPNTLLLDNALATMGAGYSAGMAAGLLYPTKEIVVVVGDGGLLMNLGDLETAVRIGVTMTIIVLNDNAYGMIKRKQKNSGFSDFGLDLPNPDLVLLAKSFGIVAERIEKAGDFVDAFSRLHVKSGVKLLECSFVYPDRIGDDDA